MKFKALTLISVCIIILINCSEDKIVELPLNCQNGYGYFGSSFGGMSPYSEDESDPWKNTHLSVSGAPENWSEVKYGDIETNIYQSVYQNHLTGNISKELYERVKESWAWKLDTLELSKEPLKTNIAFAFGKDSVGIINMIVDANNNLDFSDDKSFIPLDYNTEVIPALSSDSTVLSKSINITFEKLIDNKKQLVTAPLLITYMNDINMFMCSFPQYAVTDFEGEKIAVCSDNFTNLSYQNSKIALISDSIDSYFKNGYRLSYEELIEMNEFIEIKGEIYKNIGVNTNRNTLLIEKQTVSKSELSSTQVGFKSLPFEGNDFMTESHIYLQKFKGKYILLDFWAVWCGPCRQEFPNLRELYKKTSREKFEIVGIVGDSPSEALREIIEKDSITWTQILSTDSNQIKETFGIRSYPTTFLIDPEGVIVAKDLRGKQLETKVLELLCE